MMKVQTTQELRNLVELRNRLHDYYQVIKGKLPKSNKKLLNVLCDEETETWVDREKCGKVLQMEILKIQKNILKASI